LRKKSPLWVVILLALVALAYFLKDSGAGRKDTTVDFDRSLAPLVLTKHARCRMDCRHIDESEIKEILQGGNINYSKSDPDGKPDPKYAVEGKTHDGQQVRVIFAPSKRGMVVITVIDLKEEWKCACN
jgi:hypothetical protein